MDHPAGTTAAHAEALLRSLALAMNAVRLYPTASPMRGDATSRFTSAVRSATRATGPIQLKVDRNRFILGDTAVGEGVSQIVALGETLHGLQVGQLIIAPDVTDEETIRFLETLSRDSVVLRGSGGFRKALLDEGVANIAVVEVTLRASAEEGLLGLDLTATPLDEIAPELARAAQAWGASLGAGGEPHDVVAEAIDRLEPAARDLARNRCAESLRFLDEQTRLALLGAALDHAPAGDAMTGMLDIVAHMPPAALARLLRLTAQTRGEDEDSLLGELQLPPAVLAEVAALMRPSPTSDEQRGIPAETDVSGMAVEVSGTDEHDVLQLDRLVAGTTPRDTAARGLTTAIRVARLRLTEDAVRAVAEAIPPAAKHGALPQVADAAALIEEAGGDPATSAAAARARHALSDPALARECVRQLLLDHSSEAARSLLLASGTTGAEAVIHSYAQADETSRDTLVALADTMSETMAPMASRVLRSGEPTSALVVIDMLQAIGSRRLIPTVAIGLEHLDAHVRQASIAAIARTPGTESLRLLEKCLAHWDPETRRIAAREIGAARIAEAVPALLKVISVAEVNERNYELKKEVLKSLDAIGSERAVPALRRIASRRLVLGKKNRELRYLAGRVLDSIEGRSRTDRRREVE